MSQFGIANALPSIIIVPWRRWFDEFQRLLYASELIFDFFGLEYIEVHLFISVYEKESLR